MINPDKHKFRVGQLVSYHPFVGKTAVSSGHEITAIDTMPNNFGENVAWVTGKSGCISFNCLSHDDPAIYVLRDTRSSCGSNIMFWAAEGSYTTDLYKAKRFTLDEAKSQHNCRETDVPMCYEQLLAAANDRVDMQYLDSTKAASYSVSTVLVQILNEYDGNDIEFVCEGGSGSTFNYQKARVFDGVNDLAELSELGFHYKIWPMPYLSEIRRKSVQLNSLAAVDLSK